MLKKLWLRTVEGRLLLNTEVDANFTDLNDAASWAATGFYGGTDPSALTKVQMEIGLVWADTASGWVKRCQQITPSVVWKKVARIWDTALPQVTVLPSVDLGDVHLIGVGAHTWDAGTDQYKPLSSGGGGDGTPVGVELPFHPNAPLPPTNDPRFRYVILTAGLAGSGGYNEGVLTDETVTGSDPTITATATVSLVGSPLDGQQIDLINTSRVFLRPGPAAGPIVDSQNAAHAHTGSAESGGAHTHTIYLPSDSAGSKYTGPVDSNGSQLQRGWGDSTNSTWTAAGGAHSHTLTINNSGGNEAHPRYIPRVYLMRIL